MVLQTSLRKGNYNVKKNIARIVNLLGSKAMASLSIANNVLNVAFVLRPLFGSNHMSKNIMKSIGLSFGSEKTTQSANYLISRVIAHSNSRASKTIGLNAFPTILSTILTLHIAFMTAPIFTRMAA